MDTCVFCGLEISSDHGVMHQKGLDSVLNISKSLDDGICDMLSARTVPIPIHVLCRKQYIKLSSIRSKRKRALVLPQEENVPKKRSQTPAINIQQDCWYCGDPVLDYCTSDQHISLSRRISSHQAETKELLESVITKAEERNDDWGEAQDSCAVSGWFSLLQKQFTIIHVKYVFMQENHSKHRDHISWSCLVGWDLGWWRVKCRFYSS